MLREKSNKITDTDGEISRMGRADNFWNQKGFRSFFNRVRPGLPVPAHKDMLDVHERIVKLFRIRGIEFGNWLSAEDRYNYVVCLYFSLYDLNKILHFNGNVGLQHTIGVAFGARGQGRAVAHFEPGTNIINITRYDKDVRDTTKPHTFATSGGMGAFAHEYGHALDYFFGSHIEQNIHYRSLTYGHTFSFRFDNIYQAGTLRYLAVEIVRQAVQNEKGGQSAWYKRMLKNPDTATEYFRRHNEIFARLFEQYIQFKLEKSGITNKLLSQTKYESSAYMRGPELQKIIPLFDKLTAKMATLVKK